MLSALFLEDIGLMFDAISSASSTFAARPRPLPAQTETAAEALDLSVFHGPDAVEQAAPDWLAIERAGGAATPFQTFAMARAVTDAHLRRGEIPRITVVRRDGRPVVILPTVLVNQFGLKVARFLGDPLIQYGDALCEPGTGKRHLAAAFQAAADPKAAHAIYLRKVRADAHIAALLNDKATALNHDEAPFFDTIHAPAKSDDEPRQLRRSRRKLADLGPLRLDVTEGETARGALREALAIKRSWLATRRLPSSVIGDCDWEDALERLLDHGGGMRLRVAVLNVAGRPAAYEVAFTNGDHWYSFIGSIAEEFARHGPGRVQVADAIAYCRDNGFTRYDLLAPADDVKRGYCSGTTAVADYACALRPGGHLLAAAARLTPAAKALFVRLPSGLRRPILKLAGR